ncbi:hypothetical protein [Deinococcus pimensis]|uniref:hypothetical protein n=1 Tax=Deinococcus pimensis TaxID=309888 RepID=UPI000488D556|nr:hypothetical protein [Deinococcus pimensis]
MKGALHAAVEGLYEAFSSYTLPTRVDMSPYRDPERELGALRRLPLRNVPAGDLDAYASHAITTVGDEDLLRYALPRLLDLTARRELLANEEIVLGKLEAAGWRDWTDRERAAILAFLDAWWADVLDTGVEPNDWRAVTTLGAVAQTNLSLAPYLHVWEARTDDTAADHLASVVNALFESERAELVTDGFWDARPGQGAQLRIWLARPETLARLERGERRAYEREDEELVETYGWAVAALRVVLGGA